MWLLIASLCYVSTRPFASGCTAGEVRLVGGDNQYGGRVEYCSGDDQSVWMPVCDSTLLRWTDFEAGLACNATGLPGITNGTHFQLAQLLPSTAESCATTITHDTSLAFDCAQTVASLADCRRATASGCYSAMATCIMEKPCVHIHCPNNICNDDCDPRDCSQQLCQRNEGWTGQNCDQGTQTDNTEHADTSSSPCDSSFCLNGGTCLHPGHNCTCQESWTGKTCEQSNQIQDFAVHVCQSTQDDKKSASNVVAVIAASIGVLLALLIAASLLIIPIAFGLRCKRERPCDDQEITTHPTTRYTIDQS